MTLHIFGVRHHGPGCARALRDALEELQPDIVLVEGPPDAHGVLPLLLNAAMKPPVALLIYVPEQPRRAVYYPFTHFSPEWQALHYAFRKQIPARFMDLPQTIQLAREPEQPTPPDGSPENTPIPDDSLTPLPRTGEGPGVGDLPAAAGSAQPHAEPNADVPSDISPLPQTREEPGMGDDPLAMLAEAAGYTDHELWWEREIEQRRDATGLFEGILEAMTTLRGDPTPKNEEEAQREAHMRQTIRAAIKEGFQRIAVVCGAWHSPVLASLDNPDDAKVARADAATLKGLKQVKVEATWIPWTNSRLSYRSGYGAGIASPGWYTHLWTAPDRATIRWTAHAAHLLREQGLDASSASVIEAVRLAEALAAMGELPMPGMNELHEAIQTVLCNGNDTPMQLIREKLEIGETMGEVPAETPIVPLQRDLEAQAKRLRLKQSPEIVTLKLDLRNETDRARSQLLHRLRLLGVEWGKPQHIYGSVKGTFHENRELKWEVEFVVALIEQNIWGNTVESAANGFARDQAEKADELPALTALLNQVMLAGLPDATEHLLTRVEALAAVSADVRHLMDALPPLAEVARYGDVRATKEEQAKRIMPVIAALFARVLVGLPGACASLDDDAAAEMVGSIDNVQRAISDILNSDDMRADWLPVLRHLVDMETVHGLVRGRCCRLLLEQHALDENELQRLARLALSPVVPADQATAWVEGVLRGSGLLLLHQDGLWRALDAWLVDLTPETFVALLPLLRRAFADFETPARRQMGEKVAKLHTAPTGALGFEKPGQGANDPFASLDHERAAKVLPVLAQILGVAPVKSGAAGDSGGDA